MPRLKAGEVVAVVPPREITPPGPYLEGGIVDRPARRPALAGESPPLSRPLVGSYALARWAGEAEPVDLPRRAALARTRVASFPKSKPVLEGANGTAPPLNLSPIGGRAPICWTCAIPLVLVLLDALVIMALPPLLILENGTWPPLKRSLVGDGAAICREAAVAPVRWRLGTTLLPPGASICAELEALPVEPSGANGTEPPQKRSPWGGPWRICITGGASRNAELATTNHSIRIQEPSCGLRPAFDAEAAQTSKLLEGRLGRA